MPSTVFSNSPSDCASIGWLRSRAQYLAGGLRCSRRIVAAASPERVAVNAGGWVLPAAQADSRAASATAGSRLNRVMFLVPTRYGDALFRAALASHRARIWLRR